MESSSSSSSSEDDEVAARLRQAAVSFESIAVEHSRVAKQGQTRLASGQQQQQRSSQAQPLAGYQAQGVAPGCGEEAGPPQAPAVPHAQQDANMPQDAHRTGCDVQPLTIVQRRIADALDRRVERQLGPAFASSTDEGGQGQVGSKQKRRQQQGQATEPQQLGLDPVMRAAGVTSLGPGVRLFRRVQHGTPVTTKPDAWALAVLTSGKRRLAQELAGAMAAKRARAETALLRRCLGMEPSPLQQPGQPAVSAPTAGLLGVDEQLRASARNVLWRLERALKAAQAVGQGDPEEQGPGGGPGQGSSGGPRGAAVGDCQWLWGRVDVEGKERRRALAWLAVDGADVVAAAKAAAGRRGDSAEAAAPPSSQKKGQALVKPAVPAEGEVVEARSWVPFDKRIAVLLGRPAG